MAESLTLIKILLALLSGKGLRKILKTNDITMQFGGVTAVYKLNIEINDHEIIALIGPNGAGKTTAFNMITGVYTPTRRQGYLHQCAGAEMILPASAE